MKIRIIFFILMSILLWTFVANSQSLRKPTVPDTVIVSVKLLFNTSTVPDTMHPNSKLQFRGDTPPLTWDNLSTVYATNIGGDYWSAIAQFKVHRDSTRTIQYKAFTNVKTDSLTAADKGWENSLSDGIGGNRAMKIGPYSADADTTFLLQYVNGRNLEPQFWRPFVPSPDSVAVMFRVNMQANEGFNKTTMKLGVRGSVAPLSWTNTIFLTQEKSHGNAGQDPYDGTNFWSGTVKFPKTTAAGKILYKFVIHLKTDTSTASPTWETNIASAPDVGTDGNRFFNFDPVMPDTTLYWKFWQNIGPGIAVFSDQVIVTFRADLAKAISQNGFAYGDTLVVRSGYINSAYAVREKKMVRVGASSKYQTTDTVLTNLYSMLYYQYYQTPASGEVREVYYNFAVPGGSATSEKRRDSVTAKTLLIQDTINSASQEHRMPLFQNMKYLKQNMLVTYTCDVRPAIYQLKRGSKLISTNITNYVISDPDSVLKYGVWMNGPAVGGWDIGGAWGADRRLIDTCKMWDDGTYGDVNAGDSIFTLQWTYTTAATIGQEFKFGIYGCDNEGGYGNNHIENINDANPTYILASQFGSIDPDFYYAWDYTDERPTGVANNVQGIPLTYKLEQNYPNPFNPSTKIEYSIKTSGTVTLKIFNVLGQVVAILNEGKQEAGNYSVVFDASRLTSGMYLYQITAGNFVATKKMMLLK